MNNPSDNPDLVALRNSFLNMRGTADAMWYIMHLENSLRTTDRICMNLMGILLEPRMTSKKKKRMFNMLEAIVCKQQTVLNLKDSFINTQTEWSKER